MRPGASYAFRLLVQLDLVGTSSVSLGGPQAVPLPHAAAPPLPNTAQWLCWGPLQVLATLLGGRTPSNEESAAKTPPDASASGGVVRFSITCTARSRRHKLCIPRGPAGGPPPSRRCASSPQHSPMAVLGAPPGARNAPWRTHPQQRGVRRKNTPGRICVRGCRTLFDYLYSSISLVRCS